MLLQFPKVLDISLSHNVLSLPNILAAVVAFAVVVLLRLGDVRAVRPL